MFRRSFLFRCSSSSFAPVSGPGQISSEMIDRMQDASTQLQESYLIHSEVTPNPDCFQFRCDQENFLPDGMEDVAIDVSHVRNANLHPLAYGLFKDYQEDIRSAFITQKYVTITKWPDKHWEENSLQESIEDYLGAFLHLNGPLPPDNLSACLSTAKDTNILPEDSEVVQCIKELVQEQVKPMVQRDGGDVRFMGFNEASGVVKFGMLGACQSCPSSENTLKNGIERLLCHWLPEVKSVEEEKDRSLFTLEDEALFVKQDSEVTKIEQEFDDARKEEYREEKRRRTPRRTSFAELMEPDEDYCDEDDEDEDESAAGGSRIPDTVRSFTNLKSLGSSSSSIVPREKSPGETKFSILKTKSKGTMEKKTFTMDDVEIISS